MDLTQLAIEHAIATMWIRYNEPLSLDEIADTAILSKFYFSRVFRSMTGTSPGRFLSAIRLFKAKNLLLQTPMSVTDIAYMVGYNSLGTFTSRFSRSVGASPGRYRAKSMMGGHSLAGRARPLVTGRVGEVSGTVEVPEEGGPTRTYVGLFSSPVIEGVPVACAVLDGSGPYTLTGVPRGTWYVRAAAVGVGEVDPRPWARRPRFLGAGDEVTVQPHTTIVKQDICLRRATVLDLPILLALPELDNWGVPGCRRIPVGATAGRR
ncbi:AraC family transcriptional regulator [Actinocrinis sp.]|uniref:helix-turn-helix transcriptional regulator n=1 Tax=Actinocrinis sp. TaxID=1920516 RepID=UPI002D37E029|nr:AraC family transcriptional regulator [Actinocrinis sp.]HZP49639.1 AraC family transcriptional regulator [Actinocrinis sp.]